MAGDSPKKPVDCKGLIELLLVKWEFKCRRLLLEEYWENDGSFDKFVQRCTVKCIKICSLVATLPE